MSESGFNWSHTSGWVALVYIGVQEMFKFLAKIWPKNGHLPGASLESKLGEVIREEVKPLQDDITILRTDVREVNGKLDKHIQWHLEQRNGPR